MTTTMKAKYTRQFKPMRDHGRLAYLSFVTVMENGGKHVLIGAPTLAQLAARWEQLTLRKLDRARVQRVHVIQAQR